MSYRNFGAEAEARRAVVRAARDARIADRAESCGETNYAVTIALSNGHSKAVVHGATDKYDALRVVREHGYKAVAHIPVAEVSDEIAALIPYPMWK